MLTSIATWLLKGWLSRWALTAEGEIKEGWRWITASPVHALIAALAVSLGLTAWCWHGWDTSEAKRKSDANAFQQVMDAGRAKVVALKVNKAAEDARQAANTKRIDDATQPARAAALAAADAYARAHRCMRAPEAVAAAGQPGGNLPGPAPAPGGAAAPSPEPDVVAVTQPDFNACTLNTADLWKAFQWAQSLPKPTHSESTAR